MPFPPDTDGKLTTLAKGVNDVLNYYVQVTDTKASIFIAGRVASASFLLMNFPHDWWLRALYVTAAVRLGAALILATLVILPRLPLRTASGSVFWGNIAGCTDPADYRDRFARTATVGLLDDEYSTLNFHTARILRRKIRILRAAIICFLVGVLAALPQYPIQR